MKRTAASALDMGASGRTRESGGVTQGRRRLYRAGGYAALASGIVGVFMVAFMIAIFIGFAIGATATTLSLGWINDLLTIIVYGLALPVVPALHAVIQTTGRNRSLVLAAVAVAGLVAFIVRQWLLVTRQSTFDEQMGPVSVALAFALLLVALWLVATGYLARSIGFLPHGLRDGLLAAFFLGYPIWAINVGRQLLRGS